MVLIVKADLESPDIRIYPRRQAALSEGSGVAGNNGGQAVIAGNRLPAEVKPRQSFQPNTGQAYSAGVNENASAGSEAAIF